MRIDVREPESGRKLGRLMIDPVERPTRAHPEGADRDIFLEWEAALDDSARLRRCVICGCRDMYSARIFPQLTGIVVVLAFAGAAIGISGLANRYPVLYGVLVLVLFLDIASLVFSKRRLVCYRCGSTYSDVEIARQHEKWDRLVAERYARSRRAAVSGAGAETRTSDHEGGVEPI